LESRQRIERVKSRLGLKNARDAEEEKFQEKIIARLREWN